MQEFITADSIVVWRALCLWPEKTYYLRDIFGFWIFASACIAIADGFNTVVINIRAAGDASKVDGWQRLDSSSMLVSLSVNFAATTLILVKVWQIRQAWGTTSLGKSVPYRILIILIECGFFFCAVQSFAVISPILAGIYPSIVLLVIQQQSSIDGTNVVIYDITISNPEKDGHGDSNGHNHISVIGFTNQDSDLESGNRNLMAFWSGENLLVGLHGHHGHHGEVSTGGASNKDYAVIKRKRLDRTELSKSRAKVTLRLARTQSL
ncbi:hypothetical protein D9758_017120 [Tetrapyrgos nigripes]|uniref:Uncharacterized protein n=1 Tax=Tetrapyrgos nigripes TaxID=182062 RepID=A0A8H5CJ81_9AGAR|nr:hypothetical protein D9758_017120 [Tetrapyrgos nigripes]